MCAQRDHHSHSTAAATDADAAHGAGATKFTTAAAAAADTKQFIHDAHTTGKLWPHHACCI